MSETIEKLPEAGSAGLRREHERLTTFVHDVEPGVSLEDVLRPQYWRQHGATFQRMAGHKFVQCIAMDMKWMAKLYVYAAGDGFAKCYVVENWEAPKRPGRKMTLPDGWKCEFVSGGWRVLNESSDVICLGQPTEDEAMSHASKFFKQLVDA